MNNIESDKLMIQMVDHLNFLIKIIGKLVVL